MARRTKVTYTKTDGKSTFIKDKKLSVKEWNEAYDAGYKNSYEDTIHAIIWILKNKDIIKQYKRL